MNVANVVILLGCRSSGCSPTEELKGRVKETVNLYRSLKEKAVIIPSGGVSEDLHPNKITTFATFIFFPSYFLLNNLQQYYTLDLTTYFVCLHKSIKVVLSFE